MKISQATFWSCPYADVGSLKAGGMSIYIRNLIGGLEKTGGEVTVLTTEYGGHNLKKHDDSIGGVNVVHLTDRGSGNDDTIKDFAGKWIKLIKSGEKPDVIHAHYYLSAHAARIVSDKFKIPFVVTFHTLDAVKKIYTGSSDARRKEMEMEAVRESSGIIVSTEEEKRYLEKLYFADTAKIRIIPPGIDANRFKKIPRSKSRDRLMISQEEKIILFVGRIDPIKGIHYLIEAIDEASCRCKIGKSNFKVIILGGQKGEVKASEMEKEQGRLIKDIKMRGLTGCISFAGSQPHELLPFYYSAADIIVVPSLYESFGLVVLEAMACGRPVIASNTGGLKYLIRDGRDGVLFDKGNSIKLADAIEKLIMDKNKRRLIGREAKKRAEDLSLTRQVEEVFAFYREIIKAHMERIGK